jgi:hypothetical protein
MRQISHEAGRLSEELRARKWWLLEGAVKKKKPDFDTNE